MFWRRLFPLVLIYTVIEGFFANVMYPAKLPLLFKDVIVTIVYLFFFIQENPGKIMDRLRKQMGNGAWFFAIAFFCWGIAEIFNPLSPGLLIGLLGVKITFYYWPLALLAFAYADTPEKVLRLLVIMVLVSIPINVFGLYQFYKGPQFLLSISPGFNRLVGIYEYAGGPIPEDNLFRIVGTFSSGGQYASYLVMNIMLCFSVQFSAYKKELKLLSIGANVLNFVCLLGSGTRGGLVMITAMILFYTATSKQLRSTLFSIAFSALCVYGGFSLLGKDVSARFETIREKGAIRQRTLDTAPKMFMMTLEKYPMGKGIGAAQQAARHLGTSVIARGPQFELAENYISKIQIETGIVGVILFYSFISVLSVRWYDRWLRGMPEEFLPLAQPLSVYCLVTFFVGGFFGSLDSPPVCVFLWLLMGTVARITCWEEESLEIQDRDYPPEELTGEVPA